MQIKIFGLPTQVNQRIELVCWWRYSFFNRPDLGKAIAHRPSVPGRVGQIADNLDKTSVMTFTLFRLKEIRT